MVYGVEFSLFLQSLLGKIQTAQFCFIIFSNLMIIDHMPPLTEARSALMNIFKKIASQLKTVLMVFNGLAQYIECSCGGNHRCVYIN